MTLEWTDEPLRVALRTYAGTMQVTEQQLEWMQEQARVDNAAGIYCFSGKRVDCVCGQHENPVPLPPVLEA